MKKWYSLFLIILGALSLIMSYRLSHRDSPLTFADGTALNNTEKLINEASYDNQSTTYFALGIILMALGSIFSSVKSLEQ